MLVNKFAGFKMNDKDRISANDKDFLEKYQKEYEEILLYYKRIEALCSELNDNRKQIKDKNFYIDVKRSDILDSVKKLQTSYIKGVYSYFSSAYKVKLNEDKCSSAQEFFRIKTYEPCRETVNKLLTVQNYQVFVDDIVSQLGGLDFAGVATQQLKEKMKEGCYNQYRDKWDIMIKNNVLKYSGGFVSRDPWCSRYRVHRDKFFESLPDVISMYLYGKIQPLIGCDYFYTYNIELEEEQIGTWIEWSSGLKITAIKFYKNGRFDMRFAKPEYAREFAREWCGYSL